MRQRKRTKRIIIHHSLSHDVSAETIKEWHLERGFSDCGYHFIVRYNGAIEHGRHFHLVGAHAKGRNADSVGICVTGDFTKGHPTLWQYWGLKNLIKSMRVIYCEELEVEYHHGVPACQTLSNRGV